MARLRYLFVLGIVAATCTMPVACERTSGRDNNHAKSPEQAFALQYKLLRTDDVDGLWSLFTDRVRQECHELRDMVETGQLSTILTTQMKGLSAAELCSSHLATERRNIFATPELRGVERVSSDVAIIVYGSGQSDDYKQRFKKSGPSWKIDEFMNLVLWYKPSPAKMRGVKIRLPDGSGSFER